MTPSPALIHAGRTARNGVRTGVPGHFGATGGRPDRQQHFRLTVASATG